MRSTSRDLLAAALSVAPTLLILLLVWPWVNVPFNDDWSFAFTVKQLQRSGHLLYNHWSALPLISNAYWGLLWVKLFGFSFAVLRASTLPLALSAVWLVYLLGRRAGLNRSYACFSALLLGTSPLYLPTAASFMTDVPGLFYSLACLYCFVRLAASDTLRVELAWLVGGVVAASIGGSGRQSVYLVPLTVLPYLAWLKWPEAASQRRGGASRVEEQSPSRSDESRPDESRPDEPHRTRSAFVAWAVILSWVLLAVEMLAVLHWFARQPHALSDLPLRDDLYSAWVDPVTPLQAVLGMALSVGLFTLPALVPGRWIRGGETASKPPGVGGAWLSLSACVVLAVLCLVYTTGPDALAPWMDNTVTPSGILSTTEMYGWRPVSLSNGLRMVLTVAVMVFLIASARRLATPLATPRQTGRALLHRVFYPQGDVVLPMLALFLSAYVAALLPRCTRHMIFDRYLLPLLPAVAIVVSLQQQRSGRRAPSLVAWCLLCLFAVYATASLQEVTALARVRIADRDMLLNWGIPPQKIEMGFEFDCWTQLETTGFIQATSLGRFDTPPNCTPDLKPIARLECPSPPFTRNIRTEHYQSWLPPFDRTVYLDWVLQPKVISPGPKGK